MPREPGAAHLESRAIGAGTEEEGALHRADEHHDVAAPHLDLLSGRHARTLPLVANRGRADRYTCAVAPATPGAARNPLTVSIPQPRRASRLHGSAPGPR